MKTHTAHQFTPIQREISSLAAQSAHTFREDLARLSRALSTGGKDTPAERLAHDRLLSILSIFGPVSAEIERLAEIIVTAGGAK